MDRRRVPRIRLRPLPQAGKVVRGDDATSQSDRAQAAAFLRRFPDWNRYGLSAYHVDSDDVVDDLAGDYLERFPFLLIYQAQALIDAGLEVVPTFRNPHVTIAFYDLDVGLDALGSIAHQRQQNAYHVRGRRTP